MIDRRGSQISSTARFLDQLRPAKKNELSGAKEERRTV